MQSTLPDINSLFSLKLKSLKLLKALSRRVLLLSYTGVASRRECDKLISDGKVTVNGVKATLGLEVKEVDEVFVNGNKVVLKKNVTLFSHIAVDFDAASYGV